MGKQTNQSNNPKNQPAFLFLQGPPSSFARQVGKGLLRRGFRVHRVNFCMGDWLYWHDENSVNYRGSENAWPGFIADLIEKEGITDVIYYADRLPYHRIAASVARKLGVRDVSYEFGYLRPDWITVERGGQSAYSHFPNDFSQLKKISHDMGDADLAPRYGYSMFTEAYNEVAFNLANYFGRIFYPHYNPDRYFNPVLEYFSYLRRISLGLIYRRKALKLQEKLTAEEVPYFIVPLQMQNDYQIRENSGDPRISDIIGKIVASFAENADSDTSLVFKVHPLDNGMENWRTLIRKLESEHSLSGRVFFIDGADLFHLVRYAKGVVTVNSTSGIHALQLGTPVKVLGIAVYDMEGVTFQGELKEFWGAPIKPSAENIDVLVRALANTIQVKGDFYSKDGKSAAAESMIDQLVSNRVNSNNTYISPPPRLKKARELGIDVKYP